MAKSADALGRAPDRAPNGENGDAWGKFWTKAAETRGTGETNPSSLGQSRPPKSGGGGGTGERSIPVNEPKEKRVL